MQMDDIDATCPLVQIIHILRDEGQLWHKLGQAGEAQVSRVRLGLHDFHSAPFIPAPH